MTIMTASDPVRGDKESHYMKWLQGWKDGGAWTGASTVSHAWRDNCDNKPSGCSWYAYGLIMAQQQKRGRQLGCGVD